MDVSTLIEVYGPAGIVIFGLGWAYLAERADRKEAQKSAFDTLAQVLPVVAALQSAIDHVERSSDK